MSVQASLSLGAYDLKKNAVRSLGIAFLISLLIHFLILGGKEVADAVLGTGGGSTEENLIATGPVTLDDFEQELEEEKQQAVEEVIPPPPPMATTSEIGTGSDAAMGNLVAAEDVIDAPNIADFDKISNSDALGKGDGKAKPFNPDEIQMPTTKKQIPASSAAPAKETDIDEYIADAKYPEYDPAELQALLEYPDIARENDLEGRVVVSVQVSTTGKPLQVLIRSSTNKIFEENAKKAVRKLRFTPGTQGGHPIKLWKTFTVNFVLKD